MIEKALSERAISYLTRGIHGVKQSPHRDQVWLWWALSIPTFVSARMPSLRQTEIVLHRWDISYYYEALKIGLMFYSIAVVNREE